jgi:hypothetical protein
MGLYSFYRLLSILQSLLSVIFVKYFRNCLVPMAARSKTRTVFGRSNTGIAGLNSARGVDVCPRFSALCCVVLYSVV